VRNVIMHRAVPPNRRLQLTAFGARDLCYFGAIVCRAPRRQLKRSTLGCSCATLSYVAHGVATPSYRAQSHAKAPRACTFCPNAIASYPSCAKLPHPCPSRLSVIVPCPLACETSLPMSTSHPHHRAMLCSCAKCRRACPARLSVIAPCPLVCEMLSHKPTSPQPGRAMPTQVRNALGHAHLSATSSRHAHSCAERHLERCEQPNRRLQLTAFGARDRAHFDSFRSASAAAEAQHVGAHATQA
jgi:hypothetical protein